MTHIVVIARTRNEAHRIEFFCRAYESADALLISDGGSTDGTTGIALQFRNAYVRDYPVRVQLANGHWRNPDGEHVNFNIAWANDFIRISQWDPHDSWIILDDVDCLPSAALSRDYRNIMFAEAADYICAVRLYQWGKDQHFPHMAKPGVEHTQWEPSLWAWRASQPFTVQPVPPAYTFLIDGKPVRDLHVDASTRDLMPPAYCLVHQSWDDAARVEKKIAVYKNSELIPGMRHPLDFAGLLEPMPEWAKL